MRRAIRTQASVLDYNTYRLLSGYLVLLDGLAGP